MEKKNSYQDFLKQDFSDLIQSVNLSDLQKRFLYSRWLEQVLWMEKKANDARNWYYKLRLVTIIGGVLLPGLVSFNISGNEKFNQFLVLLTFSLSQIVAISAAIEEFFHHGERWRHYRRNVESLKSMGWQFFELAGYFTDYTNHEQAFNNFAEQVESLLQQDVEIYSTQVTQEKQKQANSKQDSVSSKSEDK